MTRGALRLGMVGCGRLAERGYLPAVRDLAEVELVAVADPAPDRAEAVAAELGGVPAFADAAQLLAAVEVDAMLVATPATTHVETARLVSDAGLPCLVEKPPAPDLAGAVALAGLDPPLAIGFNRRFLQGRELLPSIPLEGWLELELELRFGRDAWGAHTSRDEALLDAGIHLIDLAQYLAGAAPIAVRAVAISPERAELELELARGRARLRCATDRRYGERVEVRDRAGRIVAGSGLGGLRSRLATLRGAPHPFVLSLRRQLGAFAASVRGGEAGELASADDGVAALAVVEAARTSLELGGAQVTVAVPETRTLGDGVA
jgi:predicted dehydrogenase